MKIHFYLDRRKGRTERLPVFLQFWIKGQLLRTFTGEHCNIVDWDPDKERIKTNVAGASEINRLFQSMQEEIQSLVWKTKTARVPVTVNYLKDNLSFMNGKERNFFSLWEDFINSGYADNKWGEGMVRRLKILKMHLMNINKKYKIDFYTVNEKFYKAFLEYNDRQGFHISYAIKNLELFRWFMNWASIEGYNHNMTFRKFKSPAGEKINYEELYLTEKELMDLFRLQTDSIGLEVIKDMFCFSCFTGLRYSDLMKIENGNLEGDKLIIRRPKPSVTIEIPLTDAARMIFDKYHSDSKDRLFPPISIQDFNRNIKELGRMAGIHTPVMIQDIRKNNKVVKQFKKWELMSSVFARRTFINLGVNRGIGLEMMCELTGNLAGTIIHYYKARSLEKETEMQKLNIF